MKNNKAKIFIIAGLVVLLLPSLALGGFEYKKYSENNKLLSDAKSLIDTGRYEEAINKLNNTKQLYIYRTQNKTIGNSKNEAQRLKDEQTSKASYDLAMRYYSEANYDSAKNIFSTIDYADSKEMIKKCDDALLGELNELREEALKISNKLRLQVDGKNVTKEFLETVNKDYLVDLINKWEPEYNKATTTRNSTAISAPATQTQQSSASEVEIRQKLEYIMKQISYYEGLVSASHKFIDMDYKEYDKCMAVPDITPEKQREICSSWLKEIEKEEANIKENEKYLNDWKAKLADAL